MANSKKKGNRFELKVSKWFTKWTNYKFGRTPYSGANHQSRDLASDIMCQDERHAHRCKISIECKNYKEIKFEHLLLGNKGCDILKFWEQATKDARRSNKVPILCMRYNSMPSEEFFFVVSNDMYDPFISVEPHMIIYTKNKVILHIFPASEILKNVDYKYVHKQAKVILKNS